MNLRYCTSHVWPKSLTRSSLCRKEQTRGCFWVPRQTSTQRWHHWGHATAARDAAVTTRSISFQHRCSALVRDSDHQLFSVDWFGCSELQSLRQEREFALLQQKNSSEAERDYHQQVAKMREDFRKQKGVLHPPNCYLYHTHQLSNQMICRLRCCGRWKEKHPQAKRWTKLTLLKTMPELTSTTEITFPERDFQATPWRPQTNPPETTGRSRKKTQSKAGRTCLRTSRSHRQLWETDRRIERQDETKRGIVWGPYQGSKHWAWGRSRKAA